MEGWYILAVFVVVGILFGEFLHPVGFVASIFGSPYLQVEGDRNPFTVILKNKEATPVQMRYDITSDSEEMTFEPDSWTTGTMAPEDERRGEFSEFINGSAGLYTFVVHAYVNSNGGWREVANKTTTMEKK